MNWESAHAQEVGGRRDQQDRVAIFDARDGSERLLVVADGAGGHQGGAQAAQAVIDAASDRWHKHLTRATKAEVLVSEICREAHDRIVALGGSGRNAPRSTCVVLHADDNMAHWASVGDSRIYHFRRGQVVARSRDHSVVQMLVDMGKIDESEMATHPDQNRLTQSLGGEKPPEPQLGRNAVEAGDGFVLCTDGVWETVSVEEMAAGLADASLGHAMKSIVRQAGRRGGPDGDNVTVAATRLGASGKRLPRWTLALVALLALASAAAAVLVLGDVLMPGGGGQSAAPAEPPRRTSIPNSSSAEPEAGPGAAPEADERPNAPDGSAPVPLTPDDPSDPGVRGDPGGDD